jgi:hypothetical protein
MAEAAAEHGTRHANRVAGAPELTGSRPETVQRHHGSDVDLSEM